MGGWVGFEPTTSRTISEVTRCLHCQRKINGPERKRAGYDPLRGRLESNQQHAVYKTAALPLSYEVTLSLTALEKSFTGRETGRGFLYRRWKSVFSEVPRAVTVQWNVFVGAHSEKVGVGCFLARHNGVISKYAVSSLPSEQLLLITT